MFAMYLLASRFVASKYPVRFLVSHGLLLVDTVLKSVMSFPSSVIATLANTSFISVFHLFFILMLNLFICPCSKR